MSYTKGAEIEEYEAHKYIHEHGINAPKILLYDESLRELTTEWIDGHVILGYGRWTPIKESIQIALKLITQVEMLHMLGYLHGDLNPTNVIISKDNNVYLIDFEMSADIDDSIISFEEEMMDLIRLLVLLLNSDLKIVSKLMLLCEDTDSSCHPFGLKDGVDYDVIRATII